MTPDMSLVDATSTSVAALVLKTAYDAYLAAPAPPEADWPSRTTARIAS